MVSLNFTKLILQTTRRGVLTNKFNKRGTVLSLLNELHVALYYELFIHWFVETSGIYCILVTYSLLNRKRGHRTITDFPPLLTDLTERCLKQPGKLLQNFKRFCEAQDNGNCEEGFVAL